MKNKRLSTMEYLLVALIFCVCLIGALLLPVSQCPDEEGRLLLTDFIVQNGMLPTGDETEMMIRDWGFSYALRPFLSSILGALFKCAAALVASSPRTLLAASRMCSVLSVTLCCFFCLLLAGWFYLRNAVLHNGDFLGISSEATSRETMQNLGYSL